MVQDEAHVPEPQSVIQSRRSSAKLKDLFPPLPVPSVPTANEVATVPHTGKETSAIPFEKFSPAFHNERSLLSSDEVASTSSDMAFLPPLSEGKLRESAVSETTSSPSSAEDEFHQEDMLNLLKQGAVMWNQWRKEHPEIQPDLSGTDLRGATLRMVDFREVNLSGADLSETFLAGANLSRADLRNASLCKASLYRANLSGADLSGADLREAFLRKANLFETILSDIKLERTDFYTTNRYEANIDEAIREEILTRQFRAEARLKENIEK